MGKVSVWIEGFDLADLHRWGLSCFRERLRDLRLHEFGRRHQQRLHRGRQWPALHAFDRPGYQGLENKTVYAGNTYHVIVEAQDGNGWRDLDTIRVNLDGASSEDMVINFPRETARRGPRRPT